MEINKIINWTNTAAIPHQILRNGRWRNLWPSVKRIRLWIFDLGSERVKDVFH